jgi:hypothetical protein
MFNNDCNGLCYLTRRPLCQTPLPPGKFVQAENVQHAPDNDLTFWRFF